MRGRHSAKVNMPIGAKIVHANTQNGEFCIWAQVDTENNTEERRFAVIGTGWEIDEDIVHLGCVMEGVFVWHIVEIV